MKSLKLLLLGLALMKCAYIHACEVEFNRVKKPNSQWQAEDFSWFITNYPNLLQDVVKRRSTFYLVSLILKYDELSARLNARDAKFDSDLFNTVCRPDVSCSEFLEFSEKIARIREQSSASPFEEQHWKAIGEIVASML